MSLNILDQFNKNIKIRTKMIILITSVVLISVLPLSVIVLYRNQAVVLGKTFEVCRNLAENISNLATEELLINETFDTTETSISRLKGSNITGLLDTYVINVDGKFVADLQETRKGKIADTNELKFYSKLQSMEMREIQDSNLKKQLLQFAYPISILYKGEKMRVGTAVFEFDKDKVYEPVQQIRSTIIVLASGLFIIGIGIAFYFALFFSKPIQKLSEGAQRLSNRDLNHRIKLSGKDEIGQLALTFNTMAEQIQDFTQNLELKVAERTEELNRTLQEVQALKIAQDGDYYLTSLLLAPLQPNNNVSKNVKTDFMMEQKKKFVFRKWNSEIGGDICITDTIKLRGKDYTVFVNGDAMGKSIQGAGGALVLGVVFNAGLMRARVAKYQHDFPESWLKERFLDLQNVFLSFEGSMYISVCMGLIDNTTGLFYYINAEHPWTVLYRDGKASFLEQELALRKLGTPEQEENFYVRMFQLMDGDVVITGSDGRDDLNIKNADGTEYIQEDENEFLRRVEEGEGELEKIARRVKSIGAIIDDFSLLRISFNEGVEPVEGNQLPPEISYTVTEGLELVEKGEYEEAYHKVEDILKEHGNFPELLKLMGKIYFIRKDYPKAIECFDQYLTLNPGDNEYLYALSNTLRMYGKYNLAADVGERLYLRDKYNFLNLINLATIYLHLKVFARSEMMIAKALSIQPENEQAKQLNTMIQEAMASKKAKVIEKESKKTTYHEFLVRDDEEEIEENQVKADEHYRNKEYLEALNIYEQILDDELENNNSKILLKIANCHLNLNNYERAIGYFNRVITEHPSPQAHNNLGGIYFKLKQYSRASSEWKKALALKQDFKPALLNLEKLERIINSAL